MLYMEVITEEERKETAENNRARYARYAQAAGEALRRREEGTKRDGQGSV